MLRIPTGWQGQQKVMMIAAAVVVVVVRAKKRREKWRDTQHQNMFQNVMNFLSYSLEAFPNFEKARQRKGDFKIC